MTTPDNDLIVGAVLFAVGAFGFLTRRNLILMMVSTELMLHGVSLNLVAYSAGHGDFQGQAFTAFVLTVAACEAGLGLALVLALFRRRKTLDVNVWGRLGEAAPTSADRPAKPSVEVPIPDGPEPAFPRLTPAGPPPLVDRTGGRGFRGNGAGHEGAATRRETFPRV